MAPPGPTELPDLLHVGTTWRWSASFTDFPVAEGWTLTAQFIGAAAPQTLTLTATVVGGAHQFAATPAQTGELDPGPYRVIVSASLAGEVFPIATYRRTLQPDPTSTSPDQFLSHAERCLRQIEATIAARLTGGAVQSYQVAGRQLQYEPMEVLQRLRASYAAAVRRERGVRLPDMAVTFTRPR